MNRARVISAYVCIPYPASCYVLLLAYSESHCPYAAETKRCSDRIYDTFARKGGRLMFINYDGRHTKLCCKCTPGNNRKAASISSHGINVMVWMRIIKQWSSPVIMHVIRMEWVSEKTYKA